MTPDTTAVLIIGGTSDIGRAIAEAFAKRGHPLQLAGRDPDRLEREAEDLRIRHQVSVTSYPLDVLNSDQRAAFLRALDPLPGVAVSAVGLMADQAACQQDPALAERIMRTNYAAPAHILEALASKMADRGTGTLVGISSVAGDRGRASNYVYGSAKAGFTAYLSGLRNRLASTGVQVITVKPGFVNTAMTAELNLPGPLTAEPKEVGERVWHAKCQGKDAIYVKPVWRMIMSAIKSIPEKIYKRTNL